MFGRAVWTPLVQPVAAGVNGTVRSRLRPRPPPLQWVVGQALRVTRRAEGGTLTQAAVGIAQGSDPLKVNTVTSVTICNLNFCTDAWTRQDDCSKIPGVEWGSWNSVSTARAPSPWGGRAGSGVNNKPSGSTDNGNYWTTTTSRSSSNSSSRSSSRERSVNNETGFVAGTKIHDTWIDRWNNSKK